MSDAAKIRRVRSCVRRDGAGRRLSRAGAQIPARELRRPDRPGRHGAHRSRTRSRPAAFRRPGSSPACAASARPRPPASSPARSITNCRTARSKAPTINMPALGVHCQAIIESRHIDVMEMDAASHNGVDDVRQINDAIRYAPVSARYKVYILDEVHMLSGAAFNALLKTLEEPPPHAKFIFATTEIRKVPVTVLSRCQRFDLRRVDAAVLVKHLEGIAAKEKIEVEPAALALIARAAEGSVRDSLSLLDQAIAHAAGPVRAEDVRQMLGLADRVRVVDLFEALMRGDIAAALTELREQYDIGADPAVVLSRSRRVHPFRHPREGRAGGRRRRVAVGGRAHARPRLRRAAVDARAVARLADAAQGRRRGAGGRPAGRRRRDGAGAHRLCRRSADAGRGGALARRGAARRRARPQGNGGAVRRQAPSFAPRYDAPRGSPRSSAAVSPRPADDPVARLSEPSRRRRPFDRLVRGADRACRGKARHHRQDGAGARRAAGALRGRPARDRARAERAEDAGPRSAAQAHRLDRQALDRGGVARSRARRRCARRPKRGRPRSSAACKAIRWCRRCSSVSRRQDRRRDAERAGGWRAGDATPTSTERTRIRRWPISGPDEAGRATAIQDAGDAGRARPDRGRGHGRRRHGDA